MARANRRADMERLIEASSFGTPGAKAARESIPPEVGSAVALAAEYLSRAKEAERERDELASKVARVERLALSWQASLNPAGDTLRAVLDGTEVHEVDG